MIQLARAGILPYGQALAWQLQLREALYQRREADGDGPVGYVLSLQHAPTVTLGKRGELDALLDPARLAAQASRSTRSTAAARPPSTSRASWSSTRSWICARWSWAWSI